MHQMQEAAGMPMAGKSNFAVLELDAFWNSSWQLEGAYQTSGKKRLFLLYVQCWVKYIASTDCLYFFLNILVK